MSIGEKMLGKTVRHRTDNMHRERILKVGSPKPKLHSEAVAIYTLQTVPDSFGAWMDP